ncbi:MAG: hypothetical protein B5766_05430 [Candidatus Lumbricidophila eiseniae]|uniref:PIN domain-containing protein n=1 Tax=Candidatus Lumbricidiphila eiseniae TaxID=1969409 RepID=A0A2A6FS57_9MICO|nr:MAG: hypothetical protein B5766_05430 [Candidatus Lumbricidophila eiseniae]
MSVPAQKPNIALVFDVNVLIDAVNPSSPRREAAARALSDDNGMPIYLSDMMLKTTTNKLLELGADPDIVREYLELIMDEESYGPNIHVLGYVSIHDYRLRDKYGNEDYEDSSIISLMDAAERESQRPALLVTSDAALREWCVENSRMAIRSDRLPSLVKHHRDDLQLASIQYLSRRVFRDGAPGTSRRSASTVSTKLKAHEIVNSVRQQMHPPSRIAEQPQQHPQADRVRRRFPELRPENQDAPPVFKEPTHQLSAEI